MMKPILLLDVMGTLVHDPFFEDMPAFFGMSFEEMLEAKHPNAWVEFELGKLSEEEFLPRFFADEREYDHAAFRAHVRGSYRWLDGVEPILRDLAARDVPMHALSNYPVWYRWIEEKLGLSEYLEWSFVSTEVGVRKPDPEAYLGAMRRLSVKPEACLFIDDRDRNVDAARAVGMEALRFENAEALRAELSKRGVL
jgi:HAD superfamily hydrolase (TIGR01509 family)